MADGDFIAPADTLVFNALVTLKPRAVHVYGNIYAIAYSEGSTESKVSTVEIDENGLIGAGLIDSFVYEDTVNYESDIIRVSANVFAVVYEGFESDGYLKTITINNDGSIDNTELDVFEFDPLNCRFPRIAHVAGTTYAITYSYDYTGKIITVTISDAGEITEPVVDALIFDATSCTYTEIIKVADNIFAVFYNRNNSTGRVVTISITGGGSLTGGIIEGAEIVAGVLLESCACLVEDNIYAFAYTLSTYFGYIRTISIDALGMIGSIIDTVQYETVLSYQTGIDLLRVSATIICVAYQGADLDGFMKTYEVYPNGQITDAPLDTLEFDPVYACRPCLIFISGDIYAVFYEGDERLGTIKTPGIGTPTGGKPGHLMIIGIG